MDNLLKEMKEMFKQFHKQDLNTIRNTRIELPMAFLLHCSDETLKNLWANCKKNYIFIGGLDTWEKVKIRAKSLNLPVDK